MDSFPISLKLTGQPCLIVGGGKVASRKAQLLLKAGAVITVVAPEIQAALQQLLEQHTGYILWGTFEQHFQQAGQLSSYRLIIAATNSASLNQLIYHWGNQAGVLVNSVDDPSHSHFMLPAIIDRSPILISVSSQANSPVLTRQLRTQLEAEIDHGIGHLAEISGEWRARVKAKIPHPDQRRVFWEELYASPFKEMVYQSRLKAASDYIQQALQDWTMPKGEVYLVGAGPGDPELLTLKALRMMQQADVVVYDRLVSAPIMELCRRDAEKIYVGKARANHHLAQESINELLVNLARSGKRVCRLKGGDPFIFGRGGEEIEELMAAGVAFQVVPGITAASGCSAYAGIPLTHRHYAQSVRFLTGHLKEGSPELPWHELVYENQTLVLYMGLVGLEKICAALIAHGQRPDMPVALISKGTTPEQQVVVGTLADIHGKLAEHQIQAPTLTIIGEVVKLREQLQWR